MAFDTHANLAVSTIAVAPSPATSGTTATLASGDGTVWTTLGLSPPFNVVIWPGTDAIPKHSTAEIARVTAMSGDNITTMVRATTTETPAQGPIAISVGYNIGAFITKKTLLDLESGGGVTVPLILEAAAAPNLLLGMGVTGDTWGVGTPTFPYRLAVDAAGSIHWDLPGGGNQIQLVHDTVNFGTQGLGLYTDSGIGVAGQTYLGMYGGNQDPTGGGTAGGLLAIYAGGGSGANDGAGTLYISSDWTTNNGPNAILQAVHGAGAGLEPGGTYLKLQESRTVANSAEAPLSLSANAAPAAGQLLLVADAALALSTLAVTLKSGATTKFQINYAGAFGVFGQTAPTSQPATPVTLADVIALLQS